MNNFVLAKVENFEIQADEFLLACALGILIPFLGKLKCLRRFDLVLNPFGQFRSESAMVHEIESLMKAEEPMMLVMDDSRVYVGMPLRVDSRAGDSNSLTIVPWMSGGVTNGRLKVTTNYLELLNERLGPAQFAIDHPISFLLSRSVSIRGFDLEVFLKYYQGKNLEVENDELRGYFEKMIEALRK